MRGVLGPRIALVCRQCDEIFTRVLYDHLRAKGSFCSKRCAGEFLAGAPVTPLYCETCFQPFLKRTALLKRSRQHFCSRTCYHVSVDRLELGRLGGTASRLVPRSEIDKFRRSSAGGKARSRIGPARLREIALLGVAARRVKGYVIPRRGERLPRKVQRGLQFVGPLLNTGSASPARGCEGSPAACNRQVANPVAARPAEEAVDG